jgi:hypothetical protein
MVACLASNFVDYLVFLVLPFIYGPSALIFDNCSFVTTFFRNFGLAEVTRHSEMKRKVYFPFAFRSFFRNFASTYAKRHYYNQAV